MSKNFHRDYADSVGHFCQNIPASLGISAQEIDTYFRACTLCLWAVGGEAGGDRGGDVIRSPSRSWPRPTRRRVPPTAAPSRRCRKTC